MLLHEGLHRDRCCHCGKLLGRVHVLRLHGALVQVKLRLHRVLGLLRRGQIDDAVIDHYAIQQQQLVLEEGRVTLRRQGKMLLRRLGEGLLDSQRGFSLQHGGTSKACVGFKIECLFGGWGPQCKCCVPPIINILYKNSYVCWVGPQ